MNNCKSAASTYRKWKKCNGDVISLTERLRVLKDEIVI